MKYRKFILMTSLLTLFLVSIHVQGQSKSKEELGNALAQSISTKNVENFKSLLLPQEVVAKRLADNTSENMDTKTRDSLLIQSQATYNNVYIPQREENFWEIANLAETNKVDWSNLNFVVLYKYESKEPEYDPFLIHSKLTNSVYKHFYFSAVRYKAMWYLEDKMELTKEEKYAPGE